MLVYRIPGLSAGIASRRAATFVAPIRSEQKFWTAKTGKNNSENAVWNRSSSWPWAHFTKSPVTTHEGWSRSNADWHCQKAGHRKIYKKNHHIAGTKAKGVVPNALQYSKLENRKLRASMRASMSGGVSAWNVSMYSSMHWPPRKGPLPPAAGPPSWASWRERWAPSWPLLRPPPPAARMNPSSERKKKTRWKVNSWKR